MEESLRDAVLRFGFLMSDHADREAASEAITVQEIREAILSGTILEDYPHHRRGPCCLITGKTEGGRDIHIVMSTTLIPTRIITVYEPTPPYWDTSTQRGIRP